MRGWGLLLQALQRAHAVLEHGRLAKGATHVNAPLTVLLVITNVLLSHLHAQLVCVLGRRHRPAADSLRRS